MSAQVSVVTLHGMGEPTEHYADALKNALAAQLGPAMKDVDWREILYGPMFDANEKRVWDACEGLTQRDFLHRFVLFYFADAAGLEDGQQEPDSIYARTQIDIAKALYAAFKVMGGGGS